MTAPGPGGGLLGSALNENNPQADYADELYRAALDYISKGYYVFPVTLIKDPEKPGGKKQAKDGIRWGKESSNDRADIDRWFSEWGSHRASGIAIDCGKSGIVGVDQDLKPGIDGVAAWAEIETEHGAVPTFSATTRAGGRHYFYRQIPGTPIYSTNGEIAPGLDIKAIGGCLYAAPTIIHGTEQFYSLNGELPRVTDLPLAPEWLPALALKKSQKTEAARVAQGKAPLVVEAVTEERIEKARLNFEANGTPAGLIQKLEQYVQRVADEPVNGRGEGLLNELVFELSHYAPHQIAVETIRTAFRDTVDLTWVEGHKAPGFDGIDHGLRHVGTSEHRPKVWDDRPVRSTSGSLFPSPSKPYPVAQQLLEGKAKDGQRTLVHWHGTWMEWSGPQYSELDEDAIKSGLYKTLGNARYSYVTKSKEGLKEGLKDWDPNRNRIGHVLDAMKAVAHLDRNVTAPSWLGGCDTSVTGSVPGSVPGSNVPLTWGVTPVTPSFRKNSPAMERGSIVACTNGLLDISTRELLPLTPRFFNLVSVPFAYDKDAPEPKRWLGFLDSLWGDDTEAISALQEWFGYVLSGRTDLQKILFIKGPPRSGKGTIERVLTMLVGEANRTSVTASGLATNFGLQSLLGKSLAVMPDARPPKDNSEVVLERLLSISGEDPLSVARKNLTDWIGALPVRLVLMSNDLPNFKDPSGAIDSRWLILVMTKSFLNKEDHTLGGDLANELPGILNWALEGLARIESVGKLTEPESSRLARSLTQDSTSPLREYGEDNHVFGPDKVSIKTDLYRNYSEKTGEYAMSEQRFFRELYSTFPGLTEGKRLNRTFGQARVIRGIGIENGCSYCGRLMTLPHEFADGAHANCI